MTPARLACLTDAVDFKRVLQAPAARRSSHFALHHLAALPAREEKLRIAKLSTDQVPAGDKPVDDFARPCWLGLVVPKRLARRSVTRSLIKRQAREAVRRNLDGLESGLWVLRLRAPLQGFRSASSEPLRRCLHGELDALVRSAARAGTTA